MASFNFVEMIPGVTHANAHVATAAVVTGIITLTAIAGRAAIGKGEAAIEPAGKLSLKAIFESIVDFMYWLNDMVLGKSGRKYIPFFGSIFIFIFINNIFGLVPGMAPATENFNTGFAVGMFSFVFYNWYGLKEDGLAYLKHFLGPMLFLAPLMLVIEIISHFVRPVSLGLRLGGNMTGDHQVLASFLELTGVGVPVIFYFFGLFVCFIQAFVFTLLSMVYVMMASHHD